MKGQFFDRTTASHRNQDAMKENIRIVKNRYLEILPDALAQNNGLRKKQSGH